MNTKLNQVVAIENLEARQMFSAGHMHHASVHHVAAHRSYHASAHRVIPPVKPAPIVVPPAPVIASNPLVVTPNGTTLNIAGTTADEQIVVTQSGNVFTVSNGTWNTTVTGAFTQIVVRGNGGNDSIKMDSTVSIPATMYGGTGADTLIGSNANDTFYAGGGVNTMTGGNGNDTFVTLGSTGDTITGGAGSDSFWLDNSLTEIVTDVSTTEQAAGHVHRVTSFLNGISTTLNGGAIADPGFTTNGLVYKNFSSNPLFGVNGPSENDINQGYLGDCYFLSALSATAKVNPDRITQSIVSLGDGTYAVQMKQANGQLGFVRLDADLATWGVNGPVAYANLGSNGSIWVSMLEKAFTYFRSGSNPAGAQYSTIDNGGWMNESFNALGISNTDFYTGSSATMVTSISNALAANKAVTIGISSPGAGIPLIGSHAYTVDHVNRDSNGAVVSVTLRNPWGVDGAGNDGKNDGYVTVTVAQLYSCSMGGTIGNA